MPNIEENCRYESQKLRKKNIVLTTSHGFCNIESEKSGDTEKLND